MPLINCEINLILTWSANCFKIANPFNSQSKVSIKSNNAA